MISSLELRRTFRALAKRPGFTAVSVLSLAIGTGANVAIFGAVRVLLLDSLPLRAASQLVHFGWTEPAEQVRISQINSTSYRDPDSGASHRSNFTYAQYEALKGAGANKMPLTGYTFLREISVTIDGQPPIVAGGLIADGNYFSTLGLQTPLGRPLTVTDDRPDQPVVAVISHRLWTTALSGDPAVVGRGIRVNGVPVEIVGVTQAGFGGLSRGAFFSETDITLPLRMHTLVSAQWTRNGESPFVAENLYWLRIMGRLPQPEIATALEQILTPAFQGQLPPPTRASAKPPVIRLLPGARGEPTSLPGERPLLILMGVVAIVLLIACINVAGLMLARGVARQREIAVRRAIGASRMRIIREVLLESAVVAAAGTIAGVLFAVWARDLFASMLTSGLGTSGFGSVRLDMPIDWRLVASAGAIAILVTLFCGVLPALRLSTVDASVMMKQRAAGALPTLVLGRALLALQIGMSVPLLVGALVFLRTVGNLAAVELGFDPSGISFFRLNPSYAAAPPEEAC